MEPELYFKEKIDCLEEKVKMIEWAFYFFVFWIIGIAFILNLLLTATVPEFKQLFSELFAGEPLPFVTELVFNYSPYALGFDVIFVLVLIVLSALGKFKYFLPAGIIFTMFILAKICFLYSALMLPLIKMIKILGGG